MNDKNKDTFFFNNIRSVIVIFVIIIHVALGYSISSGNWWIVRDDSNFLLFDIISGILDIFIMPILFFVSGYFTLPSYEKCSKLQFIRKKFKALMIPWVIGFFLYNPVHVLITRYSRNVPTGSLFLEIIEYYRNLFAVPQNFIQNRTLSPFFYSHYHFWYLALLFWFFVIFTVLHDLMKKIKFSKFSVFPLSLTVILLVSMSSIGYFLFFRFLADSWFVFSVIQFQISRLISYICFFLFGIFSYENNWIGKLQPNKFEIYIPALLFIPLSVFCLALSRYNNNLYVLFIYSFIRYILCFTALFIFLFITKTYFAERTSFNSFMNRCSFHVYLVHLTVVVVLQYYFSKTQSINAIVKFSIVTVLSIVLSHVLAYGYGRIKLKLISMIRML